MDYEESVAWLFSTQAFGIKLGLENISRLLALLELPAKHPHILHVAGTNGKGSTCAFAESICRHHGLRTGLFTSPHLMKANERIRIDGHPVTDRDFLALAVRLRGVTKGWDPHPTFFELILAMALLHFQFKEVDVVILETGMGGRLDATSAVTPTSTAISAIGLDHTQWLGETITEIAREKAGILKPGIPLALAAQQAAATKAILSEAERLSCPVTISTNSCRPASPLGLAGEHQRENAALAIHLVANSGITLEPKVLARALSDTSWPARFQVIQLQDRSQPIVIDGAHNPAAAARLASTWNKYFPEIPATLLFASLEGKDTLETFRPLASIAERIVITETGTGRSLPCRQLADLLQREFPARAGSFDIVPEAAQTIADIILTDDSRPVLVAGSLFLAGIALATIEKLPHQPSLQ